MSKLNKETLAYLTRLCRIECTEEENKSLLEDLESILAYVDLLQNCDTENIEPCNQVLDEMHHLMRDDIIGNLLPREKFLENAPAHIGGMVKVPPVLKQN